MKCERYEKKIINCTCLKKCILFLLIGFFVYCEWECINAIIISWNDESALLCIYFAEIIGHQPQSLQSPPSSPPSVGLGVSTGDDGAVVETGVDDTFPLGVAVGAIVEAGVGVD